MCGRFVQASPSRAYAELFGLADTEVELPPRYNVAPSQAVLAARVEPSQRTRLVPLRWGLVPGWSKGPDPRYSMINARAETVHEKPAYRSAFKYRRCLIPSEGFYEWRSESGRKQPWFIHRRDHRPFAMAGLWEHWQDPAGNELESCTILVTEANPLIAPIHDRMPVILDPTDWDAWVDPLNQDPSVLRPLLRSYPAEEMATYAVSSQVNRPGNEGPALIEPLV
jgi:putative SOS response-associated peptidase YedK